MHDDGIENDSHAQCRDNQRENSAVRKAGLCRPGIIRLHLWFEQDRGRGECNRYGNQIKQKRSARAEQFAKPAADGDKRNGRNAAHGDLQRNPLFAPLTDKIIADKSRCDRHDDGFDDAECNPRTDNLEKIV